MLYHDVEQGSREWFDLRRGLPTASEFSSIITPAKGQTGGAGSKSYLRQLVGERLALHLPVNVQTWTSRSVEHGREFEGEARRYYSMERNLDVYNGGFCTTEDGRFGASPDGIVFWENQPKSGLIASPQGCIELKCLQPPHHIELLEEDNGQVPTEFKFQCHGHLLVTGAPWCDFLSYCPGFRPLLVRVEPGPDTYRLKEALEAFHGRLLEMIEKVIGS